MKSILTIGCSLYFQGVEVTECDSNSENYESGIKHPWASPSLEPSISDDSCLTSNSTTTLTSNGNDTKIPSPMSIFCVHENMAVSLGDC